MFEFWCLLFGTYEYMRVIIAKVDQVLYEGQADSLTVPAVGGVMTILRSHMPLVTTLKHGALVVRLPAEAAMRHGGRELQFLVEQGVLEVRRDGATVIL